MDQTVGLMGFVMLPCTAVAIHIDLPFVPRDQGLVCSLTNMRLACTELILETCPSLLAQRVHVFERSGVSYLGKQVREPRVAPRI